MIHESGKCKGDVQQIAVSEWNQSVPMTNMLGRTKVITIYKPSKEAEAFIPFCVNIFSCLI
jgi:hypothetical protein